MEEPAGSEADPLTPKYSGLDGILDKVGGEGLYQKISFAIFSLQWFCISWFLTGGGFFFGSVEWQCPDSSLDSNQCNKWVCEQPES